MKSRTAFDAYCSQVAPPVFSVLWPVLRIALGIQFLLAGTSKMAPGWSAEAYLNASTGPFRDFFISLAGNSTIDFLNAWGLFLIGLSLIIGLSVRISSIFAAFLMIMYFFAHFEQNTMYGPIGYHTIYFIIFLIYTSGGAGHAFGLDGVVHANARQEWLRFITK
jgi:uncharacterized membrane protein YphA (DoxX/SURF4 family)